MRWVAARARVDLAHDEINEAVHQCPESAIISSPAVLSGYSATFAARQLFAQETPRAFGPFGLEHIRLNERCKVGEGNGVVRHDHAHRLAGKFFPASGFQYPGVGSSNAGREFQSNAFVQLPNPNLVPVPGGSCSRNWQRRVAYPARGTLRAFLAAFLPFLRSLPLRTSSMAQSVSSLLPGS